MIPTLPAQAIHAALARQDWDEMNRLVVEHDIAVRACEPPADDDARAAWERLALEHDAMMSELGEALEETAAHLREQGNQLRGARAYAGTNTP